MSGRESGKARREASEARREAAEGRRELGEAGVLTLAAAPIGRAEDASARLVTALAEATLIAAEDTRRVRWLASHLNVELKARVVSYYDAVETRRTPGLLGDLQAGQDILLITDAGTPAISDPGYRLVAAAAAAGLRVTALPGPSAVTTALAVSGLPTDRFCFEGFPPRGKGQRNTRFAELAADSRTQVYFEAGRRLASTLAAPAVPPAAARQPAPSFIGGRAGAWPARWPSWPSRTARTAGRWCAASSPRCTRRSCAARWPSWPRGRPPRAAAQVPSVARSRWSSPEPTAGADAELGTPETPADLDPADPADPADPEGSGILGSWCGRPASRRSQRPPSVPGLKAMTAARQAKGTAGSTYR